MVFIMINESGDDVKSVWALMSVGYITCYKWQKQREVTM